MRLTKQKAIIAAFYLQKKGKKELLYYELEKGLKEIINFEVRNGLLLLKESKETFYAKEVPDEFLYPRSIQRKRSKVPSYQRRQSRKKEHSSFFAPPTYQPSENGREHNKNNAP